LIPGMEAFTWKGYVFKRNQCTAFPIYEAWAPGTVRGISPSTHIVDVQGSGRGDMDMCSRLAMVATYNGRDCVIVRCIADGIVHEVELDAICEWREYPTVSRVI
jgi:hypothetical protein